MMRYEVGRLVWIPCEVKPGPFTDERIIRILSDHGAWVGFVQVDALREVVTQGFNFVRAVIVSVEGGRFTARVAGEPVAARLFEGTLSNVQPLEWFEPDVRTTRAGET